MSNTLAKRGRESEAPKDSIYILDPKSFHGEETDQCLHLPKLDPTLAYDEQEEECASREEFINGVMKILEEEIATTCSTSYRSNSEDKSTRPGVFSSCEGQTLDADEGIDLFYLLEASDDDLGIPPSPVVDMREELYPSPKDALEGLWEKSDILSVVENWHFDDDFENFQQFAVYENAWNVSQLQDYMKRDFVSPGILFEGAFS